MTRLSLFISTLLSLFLNTAVHASEETLCKAKEIMIASCQLDETKTRILSFCSTADKNKVVYRFGKKTNLELKVAFSGANRMWRWLDAATYTTYFGFRKGIYGYSFGVPQETYGAKAFLDITKGGELIRSQNCIDNSFGEKHLLSEAIHDVTDGSVRNNNFLFPPKPDNEP